MIDRATLATIALMAGGTYLTRILGYLALRNRVLSPRMRYVLECVPGCVLISVIAPAFVSTARPTWWRWPSRWRRPAVSPSCQRWSSARLHGCAALFAGALIYPQRTPANSGSDAKNACFIGFNWNPFHQ
jgi:hypothetical protein